MLQDILYVEFKEKKKQESILVQENNHHTYFKDYGLNDFEYLKNCIIYNNTLYTIVFKINITARIFYSKCADLNNPQTDNYECSIISTNINIIEKTTNKINFENINDIYLIKDFKSGCALFKIFKQYRSNLLFIIYYKYENFQNCLDCLPANNPNYNFRFCFDNLLDSDLKFCKEAENYCKENQSPCILYPPINYVNWLDFSKDFDDEKFAWIRETYKLLTVESEIYKKYPTFEKRALDIARTLTDHQETIVETNQNSQYQYNPNFFNDSLIKLSKEYDNLPVEHLRGFLRNIVANTFQQYIRYDKHTPIAEQSLFVIPSGQSKSTLVRSFTDDIVQYFNDEEKKDYLKKNADYLSTKQALEFELSEIKRVRQSLDFEQFKNQLKTINQKILENEQIKPYLNTLTQPTMTSIYSLIEEVSKGSKQNWLLSDEAGANMTTSMWKGDNGQALIQFLCGAWSGTCQLSNFKGDSKNKQSTKSITSDLINCSFGVLAMTQQLFFDKLDKEYWIAGGWMARLNLYICHERKDLNIKNRKNIFDIGQEFQNHLIYLLNKLDKNKIIYPKKLDDEVERIIQITTSQAFIDANFLKDGKLDTIYVRTDEKLRRVATVYALIDYIFNDEFIISQQNVNQAKEDVLYSMKNTIDFINSML